MRGVKMGGVAREGGLRGFWPSQWVLEFRWAGGRVGVREWGRGDRGGGVKVGGRG